MFTEHVWAATDLCACVCLLSANLCRLMTLQGHADVKVTVSEAEAIFGRAEQAELGFLCGF